MSEEPTAESGLFCFMDQQRPCSSECMAYLNPPPAGKEYINQQWAQCLLLVNAQRAGKHLVILANEVASMSPGLPTPPVVK